MIMRAQEEFVGWSEMTEILDRLRGDLARADYPDVRRTLLSHVKGYQPQGNIVDWICRGTSSIEEIGTDVVNIQDAAKRKRGQ